MHTMPDPSSLLPMPMDSTSSVADEIGSASTLFPSSSNDIRHRSVALNETVSTQEPSTTDTATDLVAALLAVLQRQTATDTFTLYHDSRLSPMAGSYQTCGDSSKITSTPTTATTTAIASLSASMEIADAKAEGSISETSIVKPMTSTASLIRSSMFPDGLETDQDLIPLLGARGETQWSGLTDLISTLMASSSEGHAADTVSASSSFSASSPSAIQGSAINDIAASTQEVNEFLSPGQNSSSILSSGFTSSLLGDRATIGDLASMLSPSDSISGISCITTPDLGRSDIISPALIRAVSDQASRMDEADVVNSSELSIPVIMTPSTDTVFGRLGHMGLSLDYPFGHGGASLSSKPSALCMSVSPNSAGDLTRARTEEILQSQSMGHSSTGDQTPEGKSTRDDGTSESPRSRLFHANDSLNLEFFKVFPCKNESHVHDRKNCPFHHSQRDRRRQPVTYNAEQCEDHFDLEGDFVCACSNGDSCDKCHNRHELLYHPGIYKQRFCSSYNHLECHRGRFCAFAHTREEIRCDLFTEEEEGAPKSDFFMKKFKTLWCPYGVQHDWHGCLYAHTYQDCRRSPSIGYGSEPCPYWQKDLHSADYQKRCPFGPRCPYSHGSKEQLYHPAYYKTMPCADYKTKRLCPRSDLCAFFHDLSEKRLAIPTGGTPATSTPSIECSSAEDSVGTRLYDYTKPIPQQLMNLLQPNFMRPPLFNLDDFEAFGHASRVGSGRRESNASAHRSANNSPLASSSRSTALPSHPWLESPAYPSIHQHNHALPFFRPGLTTPVNSPGFNSTNYQPYHHIYPMYHRRSPASANSFFRQSGHQQQAYQHHTFSLHHDHQRQHPFVSNSHQQMTSPYQHGHRPLAENMQTDRFAYAEPFTTPSSISNRRQIMRRSPNISPTRMSTSRMRLNGPKEEVDVGGRSRDGRISRLPAHEDAMSRSSPASSTSNRLFIKP